MGWGLTFISPDHAASCVLASLQLPAHCAATACCCMQGAPPCWWDAEVVATLAHATTILHALGCAAQSSAAWVSGGVCPGMTSAQTQSWADVGLYSPPVLSAVGQEGVSTSPQAVPLTPMGLLLCTMKASTSSHHFYYISIPILSMNKEPLDKNRISDALELSMLDCSHQHCLKDQHSQSGYHHVAHLQPRLVSPLPSKSSECARPVSGPSGVWRTLLHCQGVQSQLLVSHWACSWVQWCDCLGQLLSGGQEERSSWINHSHNVCASGSHHSSSLWGPPDWTGNMGIITVCPQRWGTAGNSSGFESSIASILSGLLDIIKDCPLLGTLLWPCPDPVVEAGCSQVGEANRMGPEQACLFAGVHGRLGAHFVPAVLVESAVWRDVGGNREWLWWPQLAAPPGWPAVCPVRKPCDHCI